DGGDSWSPLSKIKLRDVCFVDRLNGWGLSAQGVRPELLRSADGGATWQARPIDERPEWLYQVRFVDARHGFIAAGQYGSRHGGWVLTTADGGRAWRARKVADTPIKAACFIDRLEGWAIGDQDIVHTGDGGRSWTVQLHRDNGAVHGSDIWFVDARHGWAVGEAPGRVWMTADGGRTWRVVWRGDEITLNAIRFADASTGWAVGTRYPADDEDGDAASVTGSSSTGVVLKTADGGATWRQQRFIDVSELFDVALAGREALVVAGSAAVVRRPL
ncbi:MAG: hypothetical protein FJ000_08310, partial [Actinobacteria bacterium]|nr:hypothetical protein [Actinomycetota bacterium]